MLPVVNPIPMIVSAVDFGMATHERYKIFITANEGRDTLNDRLGASLFVLEVYKEFVQQGMETIPLHLQESIGHFVEHLQDIFERLDKQLSRFPSEAQLDFVSKVWWTFGGKSGYNAILQEMKEWQDEVAHVVTAIKLLQDREKDPVIYKRLFSLNDAVHRTDMMDDILHGRTDVAVPASEVDLSLLSEDSFEDGNRGIALLDTQPVYIERRYIEGGSPQQVQGVLSDIRLLASVLQRADAASMHILPCIVYQETYERSLLLYSIPSVPDANAKWTLAKALADKLSPKPPLEVRVRFAVEICQAVLYTHAAGLVHKSIRPDNVLMLTSAKGHAPSEPNSGAGTTTPVPPRQLSAFLVGFDVARLQDLSAYSEQLPEANPFKRLYHHPERQNEAAGGRVVRFGIRHDMYSLGVLLIELGVWKPLRRINKALAELSRTDGQGFDAKKLHEELMSVAENTLPGEVGSRYVSAVLCCLHESTGVRKVEKENLMRELFYEAVLCRLMQIIV